MILKTSLSRVSIKMEMKQAFNFELGDFFRHSRKQNVFEIDSMFVCLFLEKCPTGERFVENVGSNEKGGLRSI